MVIWIWFSDYHTNFLLALNSVALNLLYQSQCVIQSLTHDRGQHNTIRPVVVAAAKGTFL